MRRFFYLVVIIICSSAPISAQELVELRSYSRQLLFTGFTRPVTEMILSGEVSGKSTDILYDVGDIVSTAEVAKIDDTFIRLDLEQNAIAQKKTLRQLQLEEKTLARFTNLMQSNSTAQADFDEAAFNADNLRLNLQSLKAEESRLLEMLQRHTLHAPVGWRIIQRFIEPGEYIRQGEPVLKLGDFSRLTVPFLLTYEELVLLQDMENIVVQLPDINSAVGAEIYRISPDFNEQTNKIKVELITQKSPAAIDERWRGGLRAELRITGKKEFATFLVPFKALISRYEANWLISRDGTPKRVILLGKSEKGDDAIVTGKDLSTGDSVLAAPDTIEEFQ